MAVSFTVSELAEALGARFEGDASLRLCAVRHPADAGEADIAFASSDDFLALLEKGAARVALVAEGADWRAHSLEAAIIADRPRYALSHVSAAFAVPEPAHPGVHPMAVLEEGAVLGEGVSIGPFVHIGAGAHIGDRSVLLSHVSIGASAQIGAGALIHPGVKIGSRVRIGARAILHQNAVIGADGFSFVTPQIGAVEEAKAGSGNATKAQNLGLARIHSLAAVKLGDDVEIGACTTIDRGTLRDTSIGDRVKIDNQVQIGHNVSIGSDCMLCAQVGIAGSAEIGSRVVLAGKVGVADHVKIGSDVLIGAASAVASNVQDRSIMMGVPAVPRAEAVRMVMASRRLPKLFQTVDALKKRIATMDSDG